MDFWKRRAAVGCMKSSTRLPDLAHEQTKTVQTNLTSRCMQARVCARQVHMSMEGLAIQKQIQEKRQLQAYNVKS